MENTVFLAEMLQLNINVYYRTQRRQKKKKEKEKKKGTILLFLPSSCLFNNKVPVISTEAETEGLREERDNFMPRAWDPGCHPHWLG